MLECNDLQHHPKKNSTANHSAHAKRILSETRAVRRSLAGVLIAGLSLFLAGSAWSQDDGGTQLGGGGDFILVDIVGASASVWGDGELGGDGDPILVDLVGASAAVERGDDNLGGGDIILVDIVGSNVIPYGIDEDANGGDFIVVDMVGSVGVAERGDEDNLGGGEIILVDLVGASAAVRRGGEIGGDIILVDIVGTSAVESDDLDSDGVAEQRGEDNLGGGEIILVDIVGG